MFEKEFTNWIASRVEATSQVPINVGDDACVFLATDYDHVVTTDTLCDQVHFDTSLHSLDLIGRKSLAVSISDILAMGAQPKFALLTFFLPKSMNLEQAKQLFQGVERLATQHGISIIGGDTNRYDGPLIAGSTLIGWARKDKTWALSKAQVGDKILVTGSFGGSILGKHMSFEPRTSWVQEVASRFQVNAATDVTDSLSLDLTYLLEQSKVGAEIDAAAIPVSECAHKLAAEKGRDPLELALTDGEDFELVLTLGPDEAARLLTEFPDVITEIGIVTESKEIVLLNRTKEKKQERLIPSGYIH